MIIPYPTKTDIAASIGITPQTLANILAGRIRPKWPTAKALAALTETAPTIWMEQDLAAINLAIATYQYNRFCSDIATFIEDTRHENH